MREKVDGNSGILKEIDRHISKILKKYVGLSEYYIKNSNNFVDKARDLKVEEDEELVSYDGTALYPSVPRKDALEIVQKRLEEDVDLEKKTKMKPKTIIDLLSFLLENTYFIFNSKIYLQTDGLAIGAAIAGFMAEIYMEEFEKRALNTFIEPPTLWRRYVDDTICKLKREMVETYLQHLNSIHPRIIFTTEMMKNGKLPFLDTEIHLKEDGSIKFKIYRKETHTDQYLQFTSNHHISQKLGIVSTFNQRIETIVTDEKDKKEERERMENKMKKCGYPEWTFKRKKRMNKGEREKTKIPYVKTTSEKIAKVYKKYGIETIFKLSHTQ